MRASRVRASSEFASLFIFSGRINKTLSTKMSKYVNMANQKLKDTKAISAALGVSNPMAGALIGALGYGKKKRRKRAKPAQGGSWFGNIMGKALSIPAGIIIGSTMGGLGAVNGLGKSRRRRGVRGGAPIGYNPRPAGM